MEGPIVGVYGIGIMFAVLFLFRIPAGFTMALVGFLGFAYVTSFNAALGMVGTDMWGIFSNYGLTVIPMFILVGEFVHYGGYNHGLYYATYRWFGHYKGGLAITTIMACAAFSAISGSNTATAATMSKVAIPEMKKYNYHPQLNAGAVAAGATLGVLIPPQHRARRLRALYGTINREAFLWQYHPERHPDDRDCCYSFLYLLAASRLGSQRAKEHLEGTLSGPAGHY